MTKRQNDDRIVQPESGSKSKPKSKSFLGKVGTFKDATLKVDISSLLSRFQETDLDQTRFLALIYIRKDGSVCFRTCGEASSLELDGLRCHIDELVDVLQENLMDGRR